MVNRLSSYRSWDIEGRNIIKNCWVGKKYRNLVFIRVCFPTGSSEANIPHHFLKDLNKIFQMHVNILPKLWLIFCCHLQKIQIMSNFWHSNNYNSRGKHDKWTNKWPHFSHILYELYISILDFKTFKTQSHGASLLFWKFSSPPLHYFLVDKIHIYMSKMTVLSLLTKLSLF